MPVRLRRRERGRRTGQTSRRIARSASSYLVAMSAVIMLPALGYEPPSPGLDEAIQRAYNNSLPVNLMLILVFLVVEPLFAWIVGHSADTFSGAAAFTA